VAGVEADYPAKAAGLRQGDRITAVDGQEVASATELIYRIRQHRWGGCLRLTLRRDGDERHLTVPLDGPPEDPGGH
jgi:putative serine protease PepD